MLNVAENIHNYYAVNVYPPPQLREAMANYPLATALEGI